MEVYEVKVNMYGDIFWLQNDKLHRLDGPAIEYADGDKSQYQKGQRHRLDGPAAEWENGNKAWYIEDKIYYSKQQFDKEIEKIEWDRTAQETHNKVRGLNPWPGAHSVLPDGRNLKIWQTLVVEREYPGVRPGTIVELTKNGFIVVCGKACLEVLEVQPESKKKIAADVFCNGYKIKSGEILSLEV